MEEIANLCNAISLKYERVDEVNCILICIWFTSLILISLFHVCFLEMNLWGAQMCKIYVPHNRWSVCETSGSFLPKGSCGAKL